jgi:hypothetical protein
MSLIVKTAVPKVRGKTLMRATRNQQQVLVETFTTVSTA